jgi:hypothetical protein
MVIMSLALNESMSPDMVIFILITRVLAIAPNNIIIFVEFYTTFLRHL